jgi:predicted Zn-dependent peptidase
MVLDHQKHELSGGTTILTRPLDANDIVALYAAIPMGSLYEADEEAGISQLVQSVLPRGTKQRSADAFQDRLAELGAELDTSAGTDMGSVTLKATVETWEPAAELFLEALTEPAFAEDEVASEVEQTLGALETREPLSGGFLRRPPLSQAGDRLSRNRSRRRPRPGSGCCPSVLQADATRCYCRWSL